MSAPEGARERHRAAVPGVHLASCSADLVELAALPAGAAEFAARTAARGLTLPALGEVALERERVVLAVRPGRWLLMGPPGSPGALARLWQDACAGAGVALDQSSALAAWLLSGSAARETLRRGCRLDLEQGLLSRRVAATQMAQVAVIVARLPAGVLLLSPASTAQHFAQWLGSAARAFGFVAGADVTVGALRADEAV